MGYDFSGHEAFVVAEATKREQERIIKLLIDDCCQCDFACSGCTYDISDVADIVQLIKGEKWSLEERAAFFDSLVKEDFCKSTSEIITNEPLPIVLETRKCEVHDCWWARQQGARERNGCPKCLEENPEPNYLDQVVRNYLENLSKGENK